MNVTVCLVHVEDIVHLADSEGKSGLFVVIAHHFNVVNDCAKEVGLLCIDTGCLVAQVGEVYVEVVERGLIMEVDAQLAVWQVVFLEDFFLKRNLYF